MIKKMRRFKRFVKKHGTYRNFRRGMRIARDVAWLKSMVNIERKYADYTFSAAITSTENFQLINGLTTGTSASTRNGQSVKLASVFVRMYITQAAAATTTQVRIFLLRDKQANAAIATSGGLLADNTNILSPLNISNGKRFKVYWDKLYRLDTNKLNLEVKKYKRLRFHIEYNTGTAGTIADITTNSLYLMMVSDQDINSPTVQFWARIRFIDN